MVVTRLQERRAGGAVRRAAPEVDFSVVSERDGLN